MRFPALPDLEGLALWDLGPVVAGCLVLVAALTLLPLLAAVRGGSVARLSPAMAWVLYQGSLFVVLLGLPLYLFSGATQKLFVWTLATPLSAAFLGANYVSVACIGYLAARQWHWSFARIACPCSLGFAIMMLYASMSGFGYVYADRPIAWIWFLVYAVVPVQMTLAWLAQSAAQIRAGAGEAPIRQPVPPVLRLLFAVQAVALLTISARLIAAAPGTLAWLPWDLSGPAFPYRPGPGLPGPPEPAPGAAAPLERYAAVWLISFAIMMAHAALERDLLRLRPIFPALILWGLLQALALARYAEAVRWLQPATWAWLLLLAVSVAAGVLGQRRAGGWRAMTERI